MTGDTYAEHRAHVADALAAAGYGDVTEHNESCATTDQWRDQKERKDEYESALAAQQAAVLGLADEWDAADEHGNPLREGSLGEAAEELRATLSDTTALDKALAEAWEKGYDARGVDIGNEDITAATLTPNPYRADRLAGESE